MELLAGQIIRPCPQALRHRCVFVLGETREQLELIEFRDFPPIFSLENLEKYRG